MAGLYLSYDFENDGMELKIVRSTYRVFRKLSPKTAVKILKEWIKDLERLEQRFPNEKDEQ